MSTFTNRNRIFFKIFLEISRSENFLKIALDLDPDLVFFLNSKSKHFSVLLDFSLTQGQESGQGPQPKSKKFKVKVFF